MASGESHKPKLDRKVLEDHGIVYSEGVYSPARTSGGTNERASALPDPVESIRQALLDFDAWLPEKMRCLFEEELQALQKSNYNITREDVLPPETAYAATPSHETEEMTKKAEAGKIYIENMQKVAEKSRRYAAANASEDRWSALLHSHIFQDFEDKKSSWERHHSLFDAFYLEKNVHWTTSNNFRSIDRAKRLPTCPKPDFTYGIPISRIHTDLPPGFRSHEWVTNFSLEALRELRHSKEFFFSPASYVSGDKEQNDAKMGQSHLMCFPWAVVELKPVQVTERPIEFCYCQAANGASVALSLLENLCKQASLTTDKHAERVPPVATFTAIGPEVKVWLAFAEAKEESKPAAHRMVCIWAGTLSTTFGIIVLRQIVKNMILWASRLLRPQISSCISLIRFSRNSPDLANHSEERTPRRTGLATPLRDPEARQKLAPHTKNAGCLLSNNGDSDNADCRRTLFSGQQGRQGSHRRSADKSTSTTPPPPPRVEISTSPTRSPAFADSVFLKIKKQKTPTRIRVRLPKVDYRLLTEKRAEEPDFDSNKLSALSELHDLPKDSETAFTSLKTSEPVSQVNVGQLGLGSCHRSTQRLTCGASEPSSSRGPDSDVAAWSDSYEIDGPHQVTSHQFLEQEMHQITRRAKSAVFAEDDIDIDIDNSLLEATKLITGTALLEAAWRAFELWEGEEDAVPGLIPLDCALREIHKTLQLPQDEIHLSSLIRAGRWEDLDHWLQAVQGAGEKELRAVLLRALDCWDADICVEILRDEIIQLTREDITRMLNEVKYCSLPTMFATAL